MRIEISQIQWALFVHEVVKLVTDDVAQLLCCGILRQVKVVPLELVDVGRFFWIASVPEPVCALFGRIKDVILSSATDDYGVQWWIVLVLVILKNNEV